MENTLSRQKFLSSLAGTGAFLLFSQHLVAQNENAPRSHNLKTGPGDQPVHKYFPSQDPELVQEMVVVSHGQPGKVKELLAVHPELAKATWDWGFGDWETALGAASHTGNKEIAELLIANGARPDIFAFTMLGNLGAVKAMIEGNPGFQKIRGPHSLTLLAHAKARLLSKNINEEDKAKAQVMVDYLTALGDADVKPVNLKISEEEKKQFIGNYSFGENPDDVFIVDVNKGGALTIKAQRQKFERSLLRVKESSFAPLGAPHVEISFELSNGKATMLNLYDPALIIKAVKV